MNEYDSEKITSLLRASGAQAVGCVEDADIVLFNTCSVREKAQEKVFSDLGRVRELKKIKPDIVVGVGGCVASQEGDNIIRRAPYVDIVFGPQTIHRLPKMLEDNRRTRRPQVDIRFPEIEKFDNLPPPSVNGVTAFVSIMEGCSKYCTFCVVPYTRGEEVSRPLVGILTEIAHLAENGVREVTLLGQNVNAYRIVHDGADIDFADLLECVADIPGIERVRYTTSHPVEFSQRLIDAYAQLPQLPDYLHLPVQSGSDRILAAMKRGYTALEYKSIIRRLRKVRPNIAISSDFIVGFPGESDDDFAQTMDLINDIGFDFSFSFLYSPRPGTPAASIPDNTPIAVKKQRLAKLQAALETNGKKISDDMVGKVETVLAEGTAKRGNGIRGRTMNNRTVNFKGSNDLLGRFVPIAITESAAHSLRGQIAGAAY